jgi:large subunit ribosomal protein L18
MKLRTRQDFRARRHKRVRHRVQGTEERPRMCVFVSNRNMYVQFVDDAQGKTLASASTQDKGYAGKGKNDVATATELGKLAAEAAKAKGITNVVFDRGGFAYAGRVKAIAEAAREGGLQF